MTPPSSKLSEGQWAELRAAYLAGAGLRALAREMGISEGTVLARSAREGWGELKRRGRAAAEASQSVSRGLTRVAIAEEAKGRAARHVERLAQLCDIIGGHVEGLSPSRLFESISRLDAFDRLARRTHGLDTMDKRPAVTVLFGCDPAVVGLEALGEMQDCSWHEVSNGVGAEE